MDELQRRFNELGLSTHSPFPPPLRFTSFLCCCCSIGYALFSRNFYICHNTYTHTQMLGLYIHQIKLVPHRFPYFIYQNNNKMNKKINKASNKRSYFFLSVSFTSFLFLRFHHSSKHKRFNTFSQAANKYLWFLKMMLIVFYYFIQGSYFEFHFFCFACVSSIGRCPPTLF